MGSSLLEKLYTEERRTNLNSFTDNTKEIAQRCATELHIELDDNDNQSEEKQTTEEREDETPKEKTIKKGKQIVIEFELRHSEIEDAIEEQSNQKHNSFDIDPDDIREKIDDMKRNLDDINNMIQEITEDIKELEETSPKEQRLNILRSKREEYHNIVKNYPPIE